MSDTYEDQFDWDNATGGGLLQEYVGRIDDADFGIDEDYRDDTVRLMVDVTILSHEDPDSSVEVGDTLTEAYNVGNTSTWEASPDGATVSRVDGKRPRFNASSGYGRLLESVQPSKKTAMAGADKLIEVLRGRGPGTKSDIWKGLTFRFERLDFSFTNKDELDENGDPTVVTYQRVYPVEFLGEGDVDTSATRSSDGDTASEAAADTSGDGPSRADLVALAANHDSFSKFLADAMKQYPGVEDGEFAEDLMSQDGIYAEAHS